MQSVSSRIWTRVAVSNDDNHGRAGWDTKSMFKLSKNGLNSIFLPENSYLTKEKEIILLYYFHIGWGDNRSIHAFRKGNYWSEIQSASSRIRIRFAGSNSYSDNSYTKCTFWFSISATSTGLLKFKLPVCIASLNSAFSFSSPSRQKS